MSAKRFSAEISDKTPTPPISSPGGPPSGSNHAHRGDNGPINIPANKYPIIRGCLILKNARVTMAARIIIIARSVTKSVCDSSMGFMLQKEQR